jgi:hypothetical protein
MHGFGFAGALAQVGLVERGRSVLYSPTKLAAPIESV